MPHHAIRQIRLRRLRLRQATEKNELLLAHLRGDADFEENLAEYHRCRKAKKPKADAARVSSARVLAGENGDRKRKREGGENGDRDRKGGDRAQLQAAGRAADVEDKRAAGRAGNVEDKRKAGRAGDVEVKRKAGHAADVEDKRKAGQEGGQSSGRARGAAARRRRGQDDAATIAATANISRFSSVRDRVEKANGMTVIQAIRLNIYTLRTLRSDESAGYIALVRTSDRNPDLSVRNMRGDDLRSADIDTWTVTTIASCQIRRTIFPIDSRTRMVRHFPRARLL